jgi:hypothetical protein
MLDCQHGSTSGDEREPYQYLPSHERVKSLCGDGITRASMDTVIATPRARVKTMTGATVVVFLALAVLGWFAIAREHAPRLALAVYGVGLVVLLTVFASTFVTYVADDAGLCRKGLFGAARLRWGEIGRYRMLRHRGLLTCVFYDSSGRRRIAINFALLEESGEALFELLARKLPELLPGQAHQWPAFPYQQSALVDARRSRAMVPVLLASTALLGLAVYLGRTCGPLVWRDMQLLRHGRAAVGTVWAVLEGEADRGVMYEFTTSESVPASGTAWIRTEHYPRYVQKRTVSVRYLPGDPSKNALEQVLRERWPQDLATVAAFLASLLSGTAMIICLVRARGRTRGQSVPVSP